MSFARIDGSKFEVGPFSSDKRYRREPVSSGDRVYIDTVGDRIGVATIASGSDAGYTGWTFVSGSYSIGWNGPTVTNTSRNVAI